MKLTQQAALTSGASAAPGLPGARQDGMPDHGLRHAG
jgi:hypothetical protein